MSALPPAETQRRSPAGAAGSTSRRWWRVGGSIVAGVVLLGATASTIGWMARETTTIDRSFDAASIRTIDVETDGNIDVTGDGTDQVDVRATIKSSLIAGNVTMEQRGDRLVIRQDCPVWGFEECSVSVRIVAPPDTSLIVRSDNGDVSATRMSGRSDLATDNGDIAVDDVTGDIELETSNGDIVGRRLEARTIRAVSDNGDVGLEFADPPTRVDARSDNGDVDVAVPNVEGAYAVVLRTENGDQRLTIPTDPGSARRVSAVTSNGDVSVRPAAR